MTGLTNGDIEVLKNYNVVPNSGALRVTPKELGPVGLELSVNDTSKRYSLDDPAFSLVEWPEGYDQSQFRLENVRLEDGEDVDTYAITVEIIPTTSNYTVPDDAYPNEGILTINKLPVHIVPNATGKTYGQQQDPDLTAAVTYNYLSDTAAPEGYVSATPEENNGFKDATPLIYDVRREQGEDVDSYGMWIDYNDEDNANYAITTEEVSEDDGFTITPAGTVTIYIGSQSKTYGDADPTGGPSINVVGLTGGDTQASMNIRVNRQSGQDARSYNWIVNYDRLGNNYTNYVVRTCSQ